MAPVAWQSFCRFAGYIGDPDLRLAALFWFQRRMAAFGAMCGYAVFVGAVQQAYFFTTDVFQIFFLCTIFVVFSQGIHQCRTARSIVLSRDDQRCGAWVGDGLQDFCGILCRFSISDGFNWLDSAPEERRDQP